jgi:hypothetical protein
MLSDEIRAWFGLLALAGCGAEASAASAPVVSVAPTSAAPAPSAPLEQAAPKRERDTVTGRVTITKGKQPLVGDTLLPSAAFEERFGPAWRDLVEGRVVRARGTIDHHVCHPDAQCMSDGTIISMVDVDSLALCRAAGSDDGVDCSAR